MGGVKVPFRLFEAVPGDSVGRQPWNIRRHCFENDSIRGRESEEESAAHPNYSLQKASHVIKTFFTVLSYVLLFVTGLFLPASVDITFNLLWTR
jgi:hypothetical protein